MNKYMKYLLIFILIDAILIGGYFLFIKGPSSGISDSPGVDSKNEYEWIVIDEYYSPQNFVEGFIKSDAEAKGLFPISIRNYGKDKKALKRFQGKNFARPTEAQLAMMYKDLEEWQLIEMKYKDKREREILRTNLYVLIKEEWRLGDTGTLIK